MQASDHRDETDGFEPMAPDSEQVDDAEGQVARRRKMMRFVVAGIISGVLAVAAVTVLILAAVLIFR